MNRVDRVLDALRTPDASLDRVPNTVRQAMAEAIDDVRSENERLRQIVGAYRVAMACSETLPDDEEDAEHIRNQLTYWIMAAYRWMMEELASFCSQAANARAANEDKELKFILAEALHSAASR